MSFSCPHCRGPISRGSVARYQFTSVRGKTIVAWVHRRCVLPWLLTMARSVRVLGRAPGAPWAASNIIPV